MSTLGSEGNELDVRALQPEAAGVPGSPLTAGQIDSTVRLVLNVPAFRLSVLRGDSVLKRYWVAVGAPRYPTRLGSYAVQSITWNPWWIPPPSDWAHNEKPTPPGPTNPMGKVKLNYSSAYYLHGTPDSTRLGRAGSHGCVRMQNAGAIELALLVQNVSGVRVDQQLQQRLLADWTDTRTVELPRHVPLDVQYVLVELLDTLLVMHSDIYRRADLPPADRVLQALTEAGLGELVDTAAVTELAPTLRNGGSAPVRRVLKAEIE